VRADGFFEHRQRSQFPRRAFHHDQFEAVDVIEEIVETENALALLGAQVAAREQAAEPAPAGAVARKAENVGRAVGEHEPSARMIGKRQLLLALDQMSAHDASDRIAVAEPEAR
jgi:hypothetical protein